MKRLFFEGHGVPNRLCSVGTYLLTAMIVWIPFLFLMPQIFTIAVALVVAWLLYRRLPWMGGIDVDLSAHEVEEDERYRRLFEQPLFGQEKAQEDRDEPRQ